MNAPAAETGGLGKYLERWRRRLAHIFKFEIRSTKHETNSNAINNNDKNKFRSNTLSNNEYFDRFYDLKSSPCFDFFEHFDIRI